MSKFMDLYAGIGGFRYGFENQSHKCVWSCEIDEYARQVYRRHWEEPEAKDVRDVQPENIPEHDILCAGFPCQSFSLAGNREGFEDSRGTLFHEICKIARVRKPAWLCLENVQGLLSTQDRKAFRVVLQSLDDIGYDVTWQVLNSKNFGVPQNRPRIFIIGGFRVEGKRPFKILPVEGSQGTLDREDERSRGKGKRVRPEICSTLSKGYNRLRANGETYIKEENNLIKLTPKGMSQGNRIDQGILDGNSEIRKLMPIECERLQGFPSGWTEYGIDKEGNEVEISDTQRYKLIGNAVTTNVVEFLAGRFKEVET